MTESFVDFFDLTGVPNIVGRELRIKWYPRQKGPLSRREYPRNSPSDNDVEGTDFFYGDAWVVPYTQMGELDKELAGAHLYSEGLIRVNCRVKPWNNSNYKNRETDFLQDTIIIDPDTDSKLVFEVVKVRDFCRLIGLITLIIAEVD